MEVKMLPAPQIELNTSQKNQIKMDAYNLTYDETTHDIACPCCKQRKSFSVTRTQQGILYHCFRASCGAKGFIPSLASSVYNAQKVTTVKTNPYKENISSPTAGVYAFLFKMYGITKRQVMEQGWMYDGGCHRLLMPVNNLYGYRAGMVAKKLPGSKYGGPKAVCYWEVPDRIKLHFPIGMVHTRSTVIVVEDILSATRVGKYASVCALLGTNMTQTQAAFLARNYTNITMMLDPDAISSAQKLKNKYSALFYKFKIVALSKDPKDMDELPLADLIGGVLDA